MDWASASAGALSMASEIGGVIAGGIIAGSGAVPGFIGVAYLLLWAMNRSSHKV